MFAGSRTCGHLFLVHGIWGCQHHSIDIVSAERIIDVV
jgi:hypothetical protein